MKSLALLVTSSIAAGDPTTPQSVLTTMCEVCTDGLAETHTTNRILLAIAESQDGEGCKTYTTPLNECYNGQTLFPGDESWSSYDIYDTLSMLSMKRTFYKSSDGSCSNALSAQDLLDATKADSAAEFAAVGDMGFYRENFIMQEGEIDFFILPFDQCVGPFGPPRPWGKFTLMQEVDMSGEANLIAEE
jgi:hypothetical protein